MKTLNFLSFASSSLLAVGMTTGAQAQTPESSGFELEEIVVTARRREESVQDVPTTINAVTGADIEKLNIRRFEDIATVVPGLTMANNGNGIGATASVRGVNYDVNASGNNGTVEFYLNDAPISAGNLFQAVYDIQQVELLRGPQGTLRGRASPSGSMTVTTRRPDLAEFGGYVSATATDIGGYNGQGAISVPIIADKLAIRVAGLYDENEGNRVKSFNNSADPESKTKSGRVTLSFQPTESFSASFTYQLTELDMVTNDQVESRQSVIPGSPVIPSANNPLIGVVPPGTPLPPSFSFSPPNITAEQRRSVLDRPRVINNEFDNYNLQLQWAFAGQRLNYVGGRNEQQLVSFEPQDVGDWFGPGAPAVYQGIGQDTDSAAETTAHELRLSNEERIGMFDYIVGAFYQKLDSPTDLTRVTPVYNPQTVPATQFLSVTAIERRGDTHEQSAFANLTAHLGEATEISGGVRYIEYEATGSLTVNNILNPLANEDVEFDTTIWNVALSHKFTDDLMAYVNVGTSWRPGITAIGDFSVQLSPLEQSFLVLPPEESTSYEVGFKTDFLDNRLRTALSLYHQEFDNYPYRSPSGVNFAEFQFNPGTTTLAPPILGRPFNFVAATPVEVDGAELEVSFAATSNWDLGLTAAYADGEIKDGSIPCNDYNPRDGIPDTAGLPPGFTAQQLLNANGGEHLAGCTVTQRSSTAPEWSGSLQTEVRLPIGSSLDSFVRGQLSIYGSSENDPTNTVDDYSGYELLNLYVGLRDQDGAWEVSLYGKNVTETEEVLARSAATMGTPLNAGTQPTNYYGGGNTTGLVMTIPREFGVNLRYSFGSR
jgi:iron complex outermembrane receptor protein